MSWKKRLTHPLFAVVLVAQVATTLGCAKIITHTYNQDRFLRLDLHDTSPRGGAATSTRWAFDGDDLVVTVDRWHTCVRKTERVFHRTEITEKRIAKPQNQWVYLVLGGVLGAGGAFMAASPDSFVAEDSEDPEGDRSSNRLTGAAAAAAGVGLIGIVVVDAIRAIDSREDMGEVRFPVGKGQPFGCREDRGEGQVAALYIPGQKEPLKATVGHDGTVRFSLGDLTQLPSRKTALARLKVGEREELIPLLMSPHYMKLFKAEVGGAK